MRTVLRFFFKGRRFLITVPVLLALGFGGYDAAVWRWNYAYSRGEQTGLLQKISVKGPPYCKYVSVEMAVLGALPGNPSTQKEFTLDSTVESALYKRLELAAREGKNVTVKYRQDFQNRGKLMPCSPSDHYIEGVVE